MHNNLIKIDEMVIANKKDKPFLTPAECREEYKRLAKVWDESFYHRYRINPEGQYSIQDLKRITIQSVMDFIDENQILK